VRQPLKQGHIDLVTDCKCVATTRDELHWQQGHARATTTQTATVCGAAVRSAAFARKV